MSAPTYDFTNSEGKTVKLLGSLTMKQLVAAGIRIELCDKGTKPTPRLYIHAPKRKEKP